MLLYGILYFLKNSITTILVSFHRYWPVLVLFNNDYSLFLTLGIFDNDYSLSLNYYYTSSVLGYIKSL